MDASDFERYSNKGWPASGCDRDQGLFPSSWKNAFSIDTLAAACAQAGHFADPVETVGFAEDRISKLGRWKAQMPGMEQRLQQYSSGQHYPS